MKDYRLDIKVRNARILRRIEEAGYTSLPHFARETGFHYQTLARFVTMKARALTTKGEWNVPAQQLADLLQCNPEDLFNERQAEAAFASTRSSVELDVPTLESVTHLALDPPDYEIKESARKLLEGCTERERQVLDMRFGMDGGGEATFEEVGDELGISRERIRQIEAKALRKMRNPGRLRAAGIDPQDRPFVDRHWGVRIHSWREWGYEGDRHRECDYCHRREEMRSDGTWDHWAGDECLSAPMIRKEEAKERMK